MGVERLQAGSAAATKSREERAFETHNWYFTKQEIEKNSPSVASGLKVEEETYRRLSYCNFLQELGMRLHLRPEVIASAMVFCHRFYLHRSHSTNDRYVVAIGSLFLAAKVEEEPRSLKDVINKATEIQAKKKAAAGDKSRSDSGWFNGGQEDVIAQEELLLTTLGFDLSITHAYETVMASTKEFGVAQESLTQVARNFLNDGLRTTLPLQYRFNQLAAGSLYLAAKFLKVQFPGTNEHPWWHCFDVTLQELEDICNQLLDLYEAVNSPSRSSKQNPSSGPKTNPIPATTPNPASHTNGTLSRVPRAPRVEGSPFSPDSRFVSIGAAGRPGTSTSPVSMGPDHHTLGSDITPTKYAPGTGQCTPAYDSATPITQPTTPVTSGAMSASEDERRSKHESSGGQRENGVGKGEEQVGQKRKSSDGPSESDDKKGKETNAERGSRRGHEVKDLGVKRGSLGDK